MKMHVSTSSNIVISAENEHLKRRYAFMLKQRDGLAVRTVGHHLRAIEKFENFTGKGFRSFSSSMAVAFKDFMEKDLNLKTGRPLVDSTRNGILHKLHSFFHWLSKEPGYKSKIRLNDIGCLKPSKASVRAGNRSSLRPYASLAQCDEAFERMPRFTFQERRACAFFALVMLVAGRTEANRTLPIGAVDFSTQCIIFDSRVTDVKFQKSFRSYFNPVDEKYQEFLKKWVDELVSNFGFEYLDPLLPKLLPHFSTKPGEDVGPSRGGSAAAVSLRQGLAHAFQAIGLERITPHSVRTTIHRSISDLRPSPFETKAFSKNLGHESVSTMVDSYTNISDAERSDLMKDLRARARENREQKLSSVRIRDWQTPL